VWETADTGDEWYWNGSAWKPFGPVVVADTVPTADSTNLITSGGVHTALQAIQGELIARIVVLEGLLAQTAAALTGGTENG